MKKSLHYKILFSVSFLFAGQMSWALVPADPLTLLSAKSSARGGSTSASSEQSMDGLLLNPASLAFQNQYAISFGLSGMGGSLGVSIVDTKSGPLGGGLYYIRRDLSTQDPANILLGNYRRVEDRAGLALFTKFSDRFSMGVTGKYFYQSSDVASVVDGKAFNGDLSVSILASSMLSFAFTAQNLLKDESGALPKAYIFGAELRPSSAFALNGQVLNVPSNELAANFALPNPNLVGWSVGGVYRNSGIELRSGFLRSSGWSRDVVSAGLGYTDKNFSVDYAFQYETQKQAQFHGVSVTGYL